MLVVGVALLVALVVGGAVALVTLRWHRLDPTSPTGRFLADELAERPAATTAGGAGPSAAGADSERAERADRVTILGLSAAAAAVVACTAVVGVLFLAVRTRAGFDEVDLAPARWAARSATPAAASVLRALTTLGSTVVALPLVAVVGALEWRRVPNRSMPAFLALVEGGQLLLVNLIKALVERGRPDLDRLVGAASSSFPSGHATTAAATFAALALLAGRRRSRPARAALAGAAAALTALVACTRVLLGVHWLTDVLAGAALGWGWAALCSVAFGGRLLSFGATVEQEMAAAEAGANAGRPAG